MWQSNGDGNEEIYATAYDTLDQHYRITISDSADITPNPLSFGEVIRQYLPEVIAFCSNRTGNYDIYTYFNHGWTDTLVAVDTSISEDILPVMTGGDEEVWVLWQTDRNGDWDIYGSFIYVGSVEESDINTFTSYLSVFPNPFKEITDIR